VGKYKKKTVIVTNTKLMKERYDNNSNSENGDKKGGSLTRTRQ